MKEMFIYIYIGSLVQLVPVILQELVAEQKKFLNRRQNENKNQSIRRLRSCTPS
jgi:hypothetical protein